MSTTNPPSAEASGEDHTEAARAQVRSIIAERTPVEHRPPIWWGVLTGVLAAGAGREDTGQDAPPDRGAMLDGRPFGDDAAHLGAGCFGVVLAGGLRRGRVRRRHALTPCRTTSAARTRLSTCLLYTSPSPRDRQKSRMP